MYRVIVDNIGTVYHGTDEKKANEIYREYVNQSETNYGRAAGEDVVLMYNAEIEKSFTGSLNR